MALFLWGLGEIIHFLKASLPGSAINHCVKAELKRAPHHPSSHLASFCRELETLVGSCKCAVDLHVKGLPSTFLKEIGFCFQSFLYPYQFLRIYSCLLFSMTTENISNVCDLNECSSLKHNLLFSKLGPKKTFQSQLCQLILYIPHSSRSDAEHSICQIR